jgi:hypothetical protein
MNWLKYIKSQAARAIYLRYSSIKCAKFINPILFAVWGAAMVIKLLLKIVFMGAVYLAAAAMLFFIWYTLMGVGWKVLLVAISVMAIIWWLKKSFFAGVSYVTYAFVAILVASYDGDYFLRKAPDSPWEGREYKFRFEDIRDGEKFFKENYPLGSDAIAFLLDMTAAGARCYEGRDIDSNEPKDTRRIYCEYTGAFFSKSFMQEIFISAYIHNGKVTKIYHQKIKKNFIEAI